MVRLVAETHSHHDHVDPDDMVALLAGHLATDDLAGVTLADCGFADELALFDLVELLAEEYGERSLSPIDAEDLDPAMTLAELIGLLARSVPD